MPRLVNATDNVCLNTCPFAYEYLKIFARLHPIIYMYILYIRLAEATDNVLLKREITCALRILIIPLLYP